MVKMSIKFSVAMSVYQGDKAEYFEIALTSVLLQTARPSEIVIVYDGAVEPKIQEIVKKRQCQYKETVSFKIIELSENRGLGQALKIAIENCTYELIARMDSDDISTSERFEKQLMYFDSNRDVSIVGGNICEFIDDISNIVGIREVPEEDKDIKKYAKKRSPLNHVTVMFKKEMVMKAGNYKKWYCNEDYYLWIRMIENKAVFHNISDNLVFVRVGKEMYRRRGGLRYYYSERRLQQYMLKSKLISYYQYFFNISIRWIMQVLLPNSIRGYLFQKFARKTQKKAVHTN